MLLHHRRSHRLQGFDYTQAGAYFVTICTHGRLHHFGEVKHGEMAQSAIGAVVEDEWLKTPLVRPAVDLDAYVIMPNHLHGIIVIGEDLFVGATRRVAPTSTTLAARSLGAIIGQFKSSVSKRIRQTAPIVLDEPLWQRGYHDHVIRSEEDLNRVRRYILDNPARWEEDEYFAPENSPR